MVTRRELAGGTDQDDLSAAAQAVGMTVSHSESAIGATEVERPAFVPLYGGWGSRVRPV